MVALLVVVALASRPEGLQLQPDIGGQPARVVFDTLFYLFLLASLLSLAIAVWALWPHPEMDLQPLERRRWPVVLAIVVALTVVGLVWWRARWGPFPNVPLAQPDGGAVGDGQRLPRRPAAAQSPDWLALLVTASAVVVVGIVLWLKLRPRRHPARTRRTLEDALGGVLDDAIEDVTQEEDPRRAVIAAWARMERLLASHGLPRRPAEAPFEYAARAFDELGLPAAGLEGLAWLFEWARFSLNEVTGEMRDQALSRLRALREDLRLAA
jgi:Domain of unknown function (DUF4129)